MMTSLFLGLAAALTVGAAPVDQTYGPYTADQTEFVGWVKFSNGEFQLYGDQMDARRAISSACVSGAASRDEMRQAVRDLGGQKVRITGHAVPWSEASNSRIEHEGSDIRNDCRAAFVVAADDIRPAN